jgi:hypothetical protein
VEDGSIFHPLERRRVSNTTYKTKILLIDKAKKYVEHGFLRRDRRVNMRIFIILPKVPRII